MGTGISYPGRNRIVTSPSRKDRLRPLELLVLSGIIAVFVGGRNLATVRRRGLPQHRRQVGVVFQDHRLLMDRSVFDNVALPLVIAGVARPEIAKRVRVMLDVENLFDKRYYASSYSAVWVNPGVERNVRVNVRYRF